MGIPINKTVAEALTNRRRRRHRIEVFNEVERICEEQKLKLTRDTDKDLWKQSDGKHRHTFKTKQTWETIRKKDPPVQWWKGIWFQHHIPKYAFFHWLAIQNRLATGDRMMNWNVGANSSCVLCQSAMESRDHLFFECGYSSEVWSPLMRGLLGNSFTTKWSELQEMILDSNGGLMETFLTRYTLQVTLSFIWRERNERRHGGVPLLASPMVKLIDRQVKNRCLSLRQIGDMKYTGALTTWIATRTIV